MQIKILVGSDEVELVISANQALELAEGLLRAARMVQKVPSWVQEMNWECELPGEIQASLRIEVRQ